MIKAKCPENLKGVHRSRIKKIIEAMELLLRHYKTRGGLEEVMDGCSLCQVTDGGCTGCPWKVIGASCLKFEPFITDGRMKRSYVWNRKRRRELLKWIEWYKAELERRSAIIVNRMKRRKI